MRVHSPDEEWVKCVSIVTLCELNCPEGRITLDRILHVASLVRLMVQDLSPRTRREWNEPLAQAVRLAFLHAVHRLTGFSGGSGGGGSGIGTGDEATGGAGDSRRGRGGDGARADGADKGESGGQRGGGKRRRRRRRRSTKTDGKSRTRRRSTGGRADGVGTVARVRRDFRGQAHDEPWLSRGRALAEPTSLEAATAPECPGVLGAVSTEESGQGQASSLKGCLYQNRSSSHGSTEKMENGDSLQHATGVHRAHFEFI